jgi:hypothetical protein
MGHIHLGEVLARRALGDGLVRVQERAGLARLARALPVELAGDVGGACRVSESGGVGGCGLLLLFGGLRGPAKPISRRWAPLPWPWPFMRPPGTAMGCPLPFALALALAMAPFDWRLLSCCRRPRAGRCAFCGGLEA